LDCGSVHGGCRCPKILRGGSVACRAAFWCCPTSVQSARWKLSTRLAALMLFRNTRCGEKTTAPVGCARLKRLFGLVSGIDLPARKTSTRKR
jgi:hypothetical protein